MVLIGVIFRPVYYSGNLKAFILFSNNFDLDLSCSSSFLTRSNSIRKLYFWPFITSLYNCWIIFNSRIISYITLFFHFFIFVFSVCYFWAVNCFIAVSTDFSTLVSICDFNCFVTFLLVAWRTPMLSTWFFSNSILIWYVIFLAGLYNSSS